MLGASSEKRNILITGGTRGIGHALVASLAAEHQVIVGGRQAQAVEEQCRRYPSAEPFIADLINAQETEDALPS